MSNAKRVVIVRAKSNPTKPNKIEFELEDEDGAIGEKLKFDKKQEMKKADHHEVTFKLETEQGVSLRFPSDKLRAMWVAKGTATKPPACPKSPAHHPDIVAHSVTANELVVHNRNPEQCLYKFALNFVKPTDTNESKLISYDPMYDNRNGGTLKSASSMLMVGVVAVGAVALIATMSLCARPERTDTQSL